jgi:cation-transporting ATPase E
LGRSDEETPNENGSELAEEPEKEPEPEQNPSRSQEPADEGEAKPGLFRRLAKRVNRVVRREETAPEEDVAEDEAAQETVLLFAYHPELLPFYAGDGVPGLPEGLIPLCRLRYTERVRPEAIETIKGFSATGVSTKVFASGAPEKTAAILEQAGLGSADHPLGSITGFELADMDAGQLAAAAQESSIFSYLTPEQAGQVVGALRQGGQSVAVVANGVSDVPAMQRANLSIAMHSSSQAALSVADILLLEDSPEVLLRVLEKGQRIVNGLLDVLKLYLTQVLYLALLFLAIVVLSYGYPYQGKQGGLISLLTLTIPSLALSLFAVSGVLPTAHVGRLLWRFVVPAAVTMGAAAFVVYWIFLDRSGELRYAQLAVTYTLVGAGLLLVIFVRPPRRFWLVGAPTSGDWLFTGLAVVLLLIFILMTFIPLAFELFAIERLRQPSDYLVVGIAVLAWAIAVRILWRIIPLDPEAPARFG